MNNNEIQAIYQILETVTDPEIPVLSILDLGIVRSVAVKTPRQSVEITITPTYSGCPAMDVIGTQIRIELAVAGYQHIDIQTILQPAWTTDWLTDAGKQKLREYGIAPPTTRARVEKMLFDAPPPVSCPRCDSADTEQLSEFGSTSCKSLFRCKSCLEPFDYFKCH